VTPVVNARAAYLTATGQELPGDAFTIRYPPVNFTCDPADNVQVRTHLPGTSDRHPGAGCRQRWATGGFFLTSSFPVQAFSGRVSLLPG
jgi:hypothetical protein